ncbi:DNA polymerase III subunit alpha [Metamycoplasma spumans]|uniref:DNA polymerase III subunit alpha n=1 Tax=Metamycoplasma spumans TaxID=92406 RepID=UPI0034DCDFB8
MKKKLINLHLNSTYSFFESCIQVEDFIFDLKKNNQEYFSVTEHNNLYSLAIVNKLSKQNNLKPIFGVDCDVVIDGNVYRYIVFSKSKEGFEDLKLLSFEVLKKGYIDFNKFISYKNLIFIEHPIFGYYEKTNNIINLENYYFSMQSVNIKQELINNHFDKCLLINHNCILSYDDNEIINVLAKMKNETKFIDVFESYSPEIEYEKEVIEALINKTNDFAKKIYFEIEDVSYLLPVFKNDKNLSSYEYLKEILKENIVKKFSREEWNEVYSKRLDYELSVIKSLNFADYFLIIQDWVRWAENNDISIGPGRGSAAGSLISYLLNITKVDPIKYGLIFERFLNPQRVTMPDIDIDVQDDRRNEVIDYLVEKYGYEYVSSIVTFSSLGKKSAIRDVLRVHNVSPVKINAISKLISSDDVSLLEEYENNKKFAFELSKIDSNDLNLSLKILNQANRISGFYRQTGTHAAGIVISDKKLIDIIPVHDVENNMLQTQVSMEYLESFGLIKMDILGLKTLSTIKEIIKLIKQTKNIDVDLTKINFNDYKTLEILNNANTAGIFQLETPIMVRAIQKIGISSFDDIVATISLNRPGPASNIPKYAKRKQGNEDIPKIEKKYDEIVKSTYGIIIYQEQIMQIVQAIANMSFSEADTLRRIISKKKADEMQIVKEEFIKRAIENNYDKAIAKKIFDSIEKFADYGFNKSHAVSYSILTYQMAYLKAHYPQEFYAACISGAHGAHETISKYVNEAKTMKINIVAPNINLSAENALIINDGIILPLTMIKGIGPEIVKNIVENRKQYGPYKNFFHLLICLLKTKSLGISVIETLIKSNSLKSLGDFNQATLLNEIKQENSDTMLLLKINKDQEIESLSSLIDSYQPSQILEANIEEEKENEINLLGQNYHQKLNGMAKYKNATTFLEAHVGNEYVGIAYCNFIRSGIAKNGNKYYLLQFEDESQKISSFIFKDDDSIKELEKKYVEITYVKKDKTTIYLRKWKIKE